MSSASYGDTTYHITQSLANAATHGIWMFLDQSDYTLPRFRHIFAYRDMICVLIVFSLHS